MRIEAKHLRYLLDFALPRNYETLRLSPRKQAVYATPLEEERLFEAEHWFVAIQSNKPVERVRELVEGGVLKVSSEAYVDELAKYAGDPGVRLEPEVYPPAPLTVRDGCSYFRVVKGGSAWEHVRPDGNFAVFAPEELADAQFELILVFPEEN